MPFRWSKKIERHETFITPDQFDTYTNSGYVIIMTSPTAFGTYKAIKIKVVDDLSVNKKCYGKK